MVVVNQETRDLIRQHFTGFGEETFTNLKVTLIELGVILISPKGESSRRWVCLSWIEASGQNRYYLRPLSISHFFFVRSLTLCDLILLVIIIRDKL